MIRNRPTTNKKTNLINSNMNGTVEELLGGRIVPITKLRPEV